MEKGKAVQNKFKLNDFQKELKKENISYYYLFLIAYNLGLNLEKVLKLTRKEAEEIIDIEKRADDIFNEASLAEIKEYLAQFNEDDYIFQALSKQKEGYPALKRVYQNLNELAKNAGINNFGSETFKKSYAYYHYQRYQDIDRIKDIFGLVSPTAALHFMGYDDDPYLCFHCNRGCIYRKKYK